MAVSALPVLTDQRPLRAGSRNHHQPTHTSAFSNDLRIGTVVVTGQHKQGALPKKHSPSPCGRG